MPTHNSWLLSTTLGRMWPLPALAAMVGIVPVSLFGLAVPFVIVGPLAMALGGLFAGVVAGWVANYCAVDNSHSRILAVVGISEAATVAVAAVLSVLALLNAPLSLFVLIALGAAGIGWAASWGARRLRRATGRARFDAVLSLSLLLLGVLIVAATIPLVCGTAATCRA